ncbi:MAG: SDR family oxidoreductase [Hyphomicrobiaceae bacterium]
MSHVKTVLVIGATGVFGSRLAAHLARTPEYRLVLSSRSIARANGLVEELAARPATKAALAGVVIDVRANLGDMLSEVCPSVVVDCSGPFQRMDYRTPLAVAEAGAHFVDLADARSYVLGFETALDPIFRRKGLTALTGASSSPALAVSAVASLADGWQRVDHIDVAITPGGQSDIGEAAVAAALSYCGRPVPIVDGGKLSDSVGWGSSRRFEIEGLGRRAVAPVETADAELLHELYPDVTSIRFWAGLESFFEQRGMRLLAELKKRGFLRQPEKLGSLLVKARKLTRFATDTTGAMLVRVVGLDAAGRWTEAEWRLIARENQGPQVPPSPAAAAVRAILNGKIPPGARPALALPLEAIEMELEGYAIETARTVQHSDRCIVQSAVGDGAFDTLPSAVKTFHRIDGACIWAGRASVETAANFVARCVAQGMGFPAPGTDVPVTVVVRREASAPGNGPPIETWTRSFSGHPFASRLDSPAAGCAWESFGALTFRLRLNVQDGKLFFPVSDWRIGSLRLPVSLAPRSDACEWEDESGRFNFDVRLSYPILGQLVRYKGWLKPRERPVGSEPHETLPRKLIARPG